MSRAALERRYLRFLKNTCNRVNARGNAWLLILHDRLRLTTTWHAHNTQTTQNVFSHSDRSRVFCA